MGKNSLAPHDVLFLMNALFHMRFLHFKVDRAGCYYFLQKLHELLGARRERAGREKKNCEETELLILNYSPLFFFSNPFLKFLRREESQMSQHFQADASLCKEG